MFCFSFRFLSFLLNELAKCVKCAQSVSWGHKLVGDFCNFYYCVHQQQGSSQKKDSPIENISTANAVIIIRRISLHPVHSETQTCTDTKKLA